MDNKNGAIIIEGHVQGLSNVRSLGEKGIPVIIIDKTNCIARYSKYCKKFFKCPDFNSEKFVPFLIDLCKKENLHNWILIPSNDHAVKNISQNKTALELYYNIITDDYSITSKIYNKKELFTIATKLNVAFPNTYYPSDINLDKFNLSFPVIVKGIEGLTFYKSLGKKVFKCENEEELKKVLNFIELKIPIEKVFIQEIIQKQAESYVCSFTAFSVKGELKTFWVGEKVREHPREFGTATFTRSISVNETIGLSRKILKELNYTGVCEIEFIKDSIDGEYKLIEMNARTWLWVWLARYCGIDYAVMVYNYLNNLPYDYPVDYKKDIKWMNLWTDIYFSTKAIITRKLSLKDYLYEMKGEIVHAVYNRNDIMPFVMMTLLLPYLIYKRV